jgi:DNA-binding NtrC family response regulator
MTVNSFTPAGETAGGMFHSQSDSGQRILVVEEAEDIRQLNAEVLVDAGYQVDAAEDGAAAWAALQLHRYDLLLTDQFLPKVSGVELLKRLHTARMTLPVIMATEILPTWEFALHPCLQAVTMLRRPYTIEKLLGLVKSVLPHAEMVSAQSWQSQPSAARLRI